MRPWTVQLLFLLAFVPASRSPAHIGDVIYPFYELLDEDLARLDLTDGSVEDWLEIVGEPSLTATDFVWGRQYDPADYDPSEVDFRIWLAWHQGSGTIWAAMERVDDIYVYVYDDDGPFPMENCDSTIILMVDGDHSGGRFTNLSGGPRCESCTPEQALEDNRQAQIWLAVGESPGAHITHEGPSEWVAREPYAAAGGGVHGGNPVISVTELRVTPFDDLIYDDEDASLASELYPGKVIGFEIWTLDNDDPTPPTYDDVIHLALTDMERRSRRNADFFVGGLLLGAGEDPSLYDDDHDSAVEPSSWARIKAALR